MIGLSLEPWVIHLHDGDRAFARAEIPVLFGSREITIDLRVLFKDSALKRATAFVMTKPDGDRRIYSMRKGAIEMKRSPFSWAMEDE